MAVDLVPQLVRAGVACFKIEGRLKGPEYVALTTRLYRQAIDAAVADLAEPEQATAAASPQPNQAVFADAAERENGENRSNAPAGADSGGGWAVQRVAEAVQAEREDAQARVHALSAAAACDLVERNSFSLLDVHQVQPCSLVAAYGVHVPPRDHCFWRLR